MASRRSQRTDDGTPLAIIQEELFEIQRQRRQVALSTPSGPPPDMPYYASVSPPDTKTSFTTTSTARKTFKTEEEEKQPKTIKPSLKKKTKSVAVVDLQDPMDVQYDPPLVQERISSDAVRKFKFGLGLTLLIFICLYLYPVVTNVPNEKRMTALTLLAYSVGLGALSTGLYDLLREK